MQFPEQLIKQANQRMKPYDVEGFVLGHGDQTGKIMIVGEAPGENEAAEGKPFIGRAGVELDKQLNYIGVRREDVYITSVVRSRPYKWVETTKKGSGGTRKANRKPNQKEIDAHAQLLDYQIEQMNPEVILALGGVAYRRLTGRKDKLSDVVGNVVETPLLKYDNIEKGGYVRTKKRYAVVALYHPAAVFYNPKIKSEIFQSLDTIKPYVEEIQKKP